MNYRIAYLLLAVSAVSLGLPSCSKSSEETARSAEMEQAAKNTFDAGALPSIYQDPVHKDAANAMETALLAFLAVAKTTKDVALLTPPAEEFNAKKNALLSVLHDEQVRHSAFKDVMQKSLSSLEDREAFARGMSAYYQGRPRIKATSPAVTVTPKQ